jgi:membrane protease YdiL (CAAX protease family)
VIDTLIWQKKSWRNYLAGLLPERRQWRRLFLTALIGFTAILLINGLLGPLSRLLGQADQLRELLGRVNRSPAFLWTILLYVPLVNALGEEVFFRLWLFRDLAAAGLPRLAAVLSAGLFSLYHLALLSGLACPLLLACLAGLFAAGLFLNHIIRRDRHILSVWLIHGLVNALIISLVLHGA